MQRQHWIALIALFPLLLAPAAQAEVRRLTLDEALALAAQQHYGVEKAQELRSSLDGRYVEERAAALPQLTANAGIVRSKDASLAALGAGFGQQSESVGLSLAQPLYTWGKVAAAIRAAKLALQTGEEGVRSARQTAQRDVTIAFADLLLAAELQRLADENLRQKERHQQEAQRRFEAGVATEYDVLAASVALENARPETIRSANRVRVAQQRLAFLLAIPDEIEAQGSLAGVIVEPLALDEALRIAAAERPELVDLRLRQRVQEELIRIDAAEGKPRLDLRGNAGWRRLELDDPASIRADGTAWDAGLFFTWPLYDGLRTRGKVLQARSEQRQLAIDERALRDAIALEVRTARNAMVEAGAIVAALGQTVGQAERLLHMAEQGFEYGVKTRLDVDDAQLNLLQAQTALAQGERDYLVARANFVWALGRGR